MIQASAGQSPTRPLPRSHSCGLGIAQFTLSSESGQPVRIQPGYTLQNMSLYAFLLTRHLILQARQIFLRYTTEEARSTFPIKPSLERSKDRTCYKCQP